MHFYSVIPITLSDILFKHLHFFVEQIQNGAEHVFLCERKNQNDRENGKISLGISASLKIRIAIVLLVNSMLIVMELGISKR